MVALTMQQWVDAKQISVSHANGAHLKSQQLALGPLLLQRSPVMTFDVRPKHISLRACQVRTGSD